MINKKTWKEFKDSGLLWWINQILHTFGWAIVLEADEDGTVIDAYPARVKFRGFEADVNDIGYQKVSQFLKKNVEQLVAESTIATDDTVSSDGSVKTKGIVKSSGHCYGECGWNTCDFWETNRLDSHCNLFGEGIKKDASEALHLCNKIYGMDYKGRP